MVSWLRSQQLILCILLSAARTQGTIDFVQYTNKILIVLANGNVDLVNELVINYGLTFKRHIIGRVYEYTLTNRPELSAHPVKETFFKYITSKAAEEIVNMYQAEEIQLPFEPHYKTKWYRKHLLRKRRSVPERKLQLFRCSPSYGMHVTDTWHMGYTGKGIVIGIVDTGAEVMHKDLASNINLGLSHNFIPGQSENDVNPDILPSYVELDVYSDHGNNCAGIVAAIQDNDICSCGVAPHAKLAILKMATLVEPGKIESMKYYVKFSPEWLIKALSYKLDDIHIYSNSYGPMEFAESTYVMNEVFRYGVKNGRNKKGSIYVFAAGNEGHTQKNLNLDGYVNSIYTIAISSVGVNGSKPDYVQPGPVVLASAYGEGVNKFDDFMVTTSHQDSCTNDFKRTSASAAMASGMIAQVLQANPDLTWRDVQHLIIMTSDIDGLEGSNYVMKNGAGLSYHSYFGYGLMNSKKLVTMAKTWKSVPPQQTISAAAKEMKNNQNQMTVEVCKCALRNLTFYIEHVVAEIDYMSYYDKLVELELCSPYNTCSELLTKQKLGRPIKSAEVARSWNFMSLQFWAENPCGHWTLRMRINKEGNSLPDKSFGVKRFKLIVYGYGNGLADTDYHSDRCDDTETVSGDRGEKIDAEVTEHKYSVTDDLEKLLFAAVGTIIVVVVVVIVRRRNLFPATHRYDKVDS